MKTEKETGPRTGWTRGPSSTGDGGSPSPLLLECSLLRYLEEGPSDNSSTVCN